MKNKILQIVLILIAIACTIVFYCLLFDEYNTLFYINVSVTCIAELILLANLPVLSKEKLLTLHHVFISFLLNLFAFTLILWIAIYSLVLQPKYGLNTLYIGLLCIVAITAIAMVFSFGIRVSEEKQGKTDLNIQNRKKHLASVEKFYLHCQTVTNELPWDKKDSLLKQLRIVLDKISAIPANKLESHPDEIDEINAKLEQLKTSFESIPNTNSGERDAELLKIEKKISMFNDYVVTIKKIL